MTAKLASKPPAPAARPSHALRKHLRIGEPIAVSNRFEFRPGIPTTCPDTTKGPCPYLQCPEHLWTVEQRDRAGNPSRGAQGESTIRASTPETCTLHVIAVNGGALSYEQIGALLGVDHTRIRQIEDHALAKLGELGAELRELLP